MIIRIGKATDNDFVVNDPHVSRYHARLIQEKEGGWLLEDLNSTNGTFVNGSQIIRKHVGSADAILLGNNYQLDFAEVLKHNNDYSEAFDRLQQVYDDYIRAKISIQSSNVFKTRVFQTVPFAMIAVGGAMFGFLGKENPVLFGFGIFIAICAPVIGIYLGARQSAKTPKQLQELVDRFKTDYVCPKCGVFLGEVPWQSLRNKKQCPVPSCKARWTKD